MRTIIPLLFVLAGWHARAQDPTDTLPDKDTGDPAGAGVEINKDGINVTFGDKDKDKKKKNDVFDFGIFNGLDIGFNAFMWDGDLNQPLGFDQYSQRIGNSTNVHLRFLNITLRPETWVSMNFALALDYNDWALENNVSLQPDQPTVTFVEEPINFSKNKFKAKYLALPFNLQLSTASNITLTGGFEPQFLLRGRMKQRSAEEGKTKVDDNFNLREFRYAWVGRLGYNGFSVYCRYYPKSIFADGEGPDVQNIALGIGWGL